MVEVVWPQVQESSGNWVGSEVVDIETDPTERGDGRRYGQLLGQCKVLIDEAIKNNKYKDTMAGLKSLMAKVQQDEPVVPIVRNPAVKHGQGSGRSIDKKKAKHSP